MVEESRSERRLKKFLEELNKHGEIRKMEIKSFLEETLTKIDMDMNGYKEGYKIISIERSEKNYLLNNNLLSQITNIIKEKYDCKLNSFSVTENSFSGRAYFFVFEK